MRHHAQNPPVTIAHARYSLWRSVGIEGVDFCGRQCCVVNVSQGCKVIITERLCFYAVVALVLCGQGGRASEVCSPFSVSYCDGHGCSAHAVEEHAWRYTRGRRWVSDFDHGEARFILLGLVALKGWPVLCARDEGGEFVEDLASIAHT